MNIDDIKNIIINNSNGLDHEYKRLFHGRGGLYAGWKFLTVDSIDTILSVAFYDEVSEADEKCVIAMLETFMLTSRHESIVLQRRALPGAPSEVMVGVVAPEVIAIENGLQIKLNLLHNRNSGYFPDMKNGRAFVKAMAKDKVVLNLFSYTCLFSVCAMLGGASRVVNVDMSKGALSTGRANHKLNGFIKEIKYWPYNILKSFSRIRKPAPYGLIIIDPPSFQKGSFEASKDYIKIIRRLNELATKDTLVLACLNSPELDSQFLIDLFSEHAQEFTFVKRLENVAEFASSDEERSLKNLVFKLS